MPWNHNTHYWPLLLSLLPGTTDAVLEVGCGDGRLATRLAERCGRVTALDLDSSQVQLARERCGGSSNVTVVEGDFRTAELPADHFDAVVASAALHHMPLHSATARARALLRPGGRLLVLGVWTDRGPRDVGWNWRSARLDRRLQAELGPDEMIAPVTLDRTSWHETRAWYREHFPEASLTRLPLWRYTLVWDKPLAC